jgi:hypothetical protein
MVTALIRTTFRASRTRVAVVTAMLIAGYWAGAAAQEGHPLKGSWLGEWASNAVHGENVLLVLDWDGQEITGIINPGTDNIEIDEASLDPDGWVVRLEADAEDGSGGALHYVIEGRIENLELPNRSIVGTWKSERGEGAFAVSRQ